MTIHAMKQTVVNKLHLRAIAWQDIQVKIVISVFHLRLLENANNTVNMAGIHACLEVSVILPQDVAVVQMD